MNTDSGKLAFRFWMAKCLGLLWLVSLSGQALAQSVSFTFNITNPPPGNQQPYSGNYVSVVSQSELQTNETATVNYLQLQATSAAGSNLTFNLSDPKGRGSFTDLSGNTLTSVTINAQNIVSPPFLFKPNQTIQLPPQQSSYASLTATATNSSYKVGALKVDIYPVASQIVPYFFNGSSEYVGCSDFSFQLQNPAGVPAAVPFAATFTIAPTGGSSEAAEYGCVGASSQQPNYSVLLGAGSDGLIQFGILATKAGGSTSVNVTASASGSGLTQGSATYQLHPGPATGFSLTSSIPVAGSSYQVVSTATDQYGNNTAINNAYQPLFITASGSGYTQLCPASGACNNPYPQGASPTTLTALAPQTIGTYLLEGTPISGNSEPGAPSYSIVFQVVAGSASKLVFTTPTGGQLPPQVTAGPVQMIVNLEDPYGNPVLAPAGGAQIFLGLGTFSSDTAGNSQINMVTIPANQSQSPPFYFDAFQAPGGYAGYTPYGMYENLTGSFNLTVVSGPVYYVNLALPSSSYAVTAGLCSAPLTPTYRDFYKNPVLNPAGTIVMASSDTNKTFYTDSKCKLPQSSSNVFGPLSPIYIEDSTSTSSNSAASFSLTATYIPTYSSTSVTSNTLSNIPFLYPNLEVTSISGALNSLLPGFSQGNLSSINFGDAIVGGNPLLVVVTLYNAGTAPIVGNLNLSSSTAALTASPVSSSPCASLAKGASCYVTVTLTAPSAAGSLNNASVSVVDSNQTLKLGAAATYVQPGSLGSQGNPAYGSATQTLTGFNTTAIVKLPAPAPDPSLIAYIGNYNGSTPYPEMVEVYESTKNGETSGGVYQTIPFKNGIVPGHFDQVNAATYFRGFIYLAGTTCVSPNYECSPFIVAVDQNGVTRFGPTILTNSNGGSVMGAFNTLIAFNVPNGQSYLIAAGSETKESSSATLLADFSLELATNGMLTGSIGAITAVQYLGSPSNGAVYQLAAAASTETGLIELFNVDSFGGNPQLETDSASTWKGGSTTLSVTSATGFALGSGVTKTLVGGTPTALALDPGGNPILAYLTDGNGNGSQGGIVVYKGSNGALVQNLATAGAITQMAFNPTDSGQWAIVTGGSLGSLAQASRYLESPTTFKLSSDSAWIFSGSGGDTSTCGSSILNAVIDGLLFGSCLNTSGNTPAAVTSVNFY